MSFGKTLRLALFMAALAARPALAEAAAMVAPSLQAADLSTSSIQLSWVDPNRRSFGYEIQQSLNASTGFVTVATLSKTVASYVSSGLNAGTTYYFRMRVKGAKGTYSPYSNVASAATVPSSTPVASSTPAPSATTTPTFTAVATSSPVPITTVTPTVTALPTSTPVPTKSTTPTVTAVVTSTPVPTRTTTPTVTATATPVPTSTPLPAPTTTPDTAPPTTPANLSASAAACSQVSLTWGASADDGGSGLQGYMVYRKNVTIGETSYSWLKEVMAPSTWTSDMALTKSTQYSYYARAIDNAGNLSTSSNTANATTPACNQAPLANAGPDQTATVGASVTLNGSGSSDPDGTIASYAWTFGDGGSASGITVNHAYATAGTFVATLTVTDNQGLQGSDTAVVNVAAGGVTGTYQGAWCDGSTGLDMARATAVDKRANCDGANGTNCIIVTGWVTGTVDLGGGPRSAVGGGANDLFVAKYTATGGHLWSQVFGGTNTERGNAVAVDASGNVIVVGYTRSPTVSFGGMALLGTAAGDADVIVAKYAGTNGAHMWSKRLGDVGYDYGNGVAVDQSSNCDGNNGTDCVVVVGRFDPPANFGGETLSNVWGIVTDMFVAKYSSTGTYRWAKNFYNTSESSGQAVAVDASGNVAVTGYFIGTMDMGGGELTTGVSGNVFIGKLSAGGAHLWSWGLGNFDGRDVGNGVAMDKSGNVVVAGTMQGPASFGGNVLQADTAGDMFVAKYAAANGAHVWSLRGGGPNYDTGMGVTTDGSDNVVVTGSFTGTAGFGGTSLVSAGGQDIYVAKYAAATGAHLWSKGFGGLLDDGGLAVTADAGSNVIAVGDLEDVVNFGGGPLTSAGSFDAFVLKLTP